MNKQLLAAIASIATMTASTPAWADGDNTTADTTTLSVAGVNPPKCNLTSSSTVVTLANNAVSNNNGFAVSNVDAQIAAALNNLSVNAWCTGAANTVTLARTSLMRDGSTGTKTTEGFNQAIIYDISMSIAGVGSAAAGGGGGNGNGNGGGNGNGNQGCGNGNGGPANPGACGGTISTAGGVGTANAGRFGPTQSGSAVTFAAAGSSNATSVGGTGTGARTVFTSDAARLAAGTYSGTVTVTISPGG